MDLKENLFDLSEEELKMSKAIYGGKVIKCVVAPFHTYHELESVVSFTPTTYLFPERECTMPQLRSFINMIVNRDSDGEHRIITSGCVNIKLNI